jgi:tRNA (cmo5U34)-methyltransferase
MEYICLDLEGVLVPLTYDENVNMFNDAGFNHVESFFRWYNFAGFLVIKG